MSGVTLSERTFAAGPQRWKVNRNGDWYVQTFGWHPTGPNPRYSWMYVEKDRVPKDILKAAGES